VIQTVTGPVAREDIAGPVLSHEHLALQYDGAGPEARLSRTDLVIRELTDLGRRHGLGLLVELSCHGLHRDAAVMHQVSVATSIPVVAATGYYWDEFHPAGLARLTTEQLTEQLLEEIRHGLDGTDVRPGVLGEAGSHGERPSPAEERCLRATARAALASGLSVATHTELGAGGRAQLDILCGEGLPPERISIGHQDLAPDAAEVRAVARRGAYVAIDTIGKEAFQSDGYRARLVAWLASAGHADRVLLSNDVSRDTYLFRPTGGYGHLFDSFLGLLRLAGLRDEDLDLILHDNPVRFLDP
jgi:phosphotriesterase-related protein